MSDSRVEYVGFTVNEVSRNYCLRAKLPDGDFQDFTLAILNKAFVDSLVRYQDAPDLCFLKLQRELVAAGGNLPALHHELTNAELEEYRLSHTPRPKEKRRRALP